MRVENALELTRRLFPRRGESGIHLFTYTLISGLSGPDFFPILSKAWRHKRLGVSTASFNCFTFQDIEILLRISLLYDDP
jgi:hypothetical protein